ncbi:hypothetical protein RIF29_38581 [Crotalaria pallida]|uniref:Uncharacterized protein n=1 Tax=Crotalaria pallida TaxID=3830 RepID=A0AAN9E083_CROPI
MPLTLSRRNSTFISPPSLTDTNSGGGTRFLCDDVYLSDDTDNDDDNSDVEVQPYLLDQQAALEIERKAVAVESERRAIEKEATEAAACLAYKASSLSNGENKESGIVYRAASSALNLEQGRLQKLKDLCERNQMIRSSSSLDKDYSHHESHILRLIRQIRGVTGNVLSKATDLTKLLNDPLMSSINQRGDIC